MALTPDAGTIQLRDVGANGGKRRIAIIGSTGSIGCSALEVLRMHHDRFELILLAAGSNVELLSQQAREFKPRFLHLADGPARGQLLEISAGIPEVEVLESEDEMHELLRGDDIDLVLAAAVGFAGLPSVIAALEGGKCVALANKESLVSAGALISEVIEREGGALIPVDSEHSAIFQCMQGESRLDVSSLVLTASGGPFRGFSSEQLAEVTPEQALRHPTWKMGAKITVDSATMVNKSFELAEAHWLFDIAPDKISILVHPQSIIHSMVNFCDGSSIAQLGVPDMKVAIAYALNYPQGRLGGIAPQLDLALLKTLEFHQLNSETFRAPDLMRQSITQGGAACAVFTIANDIAVERFMGGTLSFQGIPDTIEKALAMFGSESYRSLSDLLSLRDRIYDSGAITG